MPSICKKREKMRVKGSVMVDGVVRQKWWPDDSRASLRAAVLWEEQVRKEMLEQTAIEQTATVCVTLADWLESYLDHVQARQSGKTYVEKAHCYRLFCAHFGADAPLVGVVMDTQGRMALAQVSRFFDGQAKDRSGNAANKHRKNLGAAWEYGKQHVPGFPAHIPNPFHECTPHPAEEEPRYVPPLADFMAVYDTLRGDDAATVQDRLMLLTYLHTAARRGEVFRLCWQHWDREERQLCLGTRKRRGGGLEYDWLPSTAELSAGLESWRQAHPYPDQPHVFVCLEDSPFTESYLGRPFSVRQHWLPRLCERAGVTPFGIHAIRHLTARALQKGGHPVGFIQRVLRHKAESTTRRYLAKLGCEDIRAVVDMGMPRIGGRVIPFPAAQKQSASRRAASGG